MLALDARLAVIGQTLAIRGEALKFARDRAEVGYTSQLEWRQAQAKYRATAQLVPQIKAQIARQENALSVLIGELPGDIHRGGTLADLRQPPPPSMVPSDLLRNRPDIAAAEYQLAATDAQMRAARARFMPTLGIGAAAGVAISDLLDGPISVWSLGGSLLATIFNGGRLQGQRVAVADALPHARNRYRSGYTPYIEQVDSQRSLLGVELSLIQLEADEITAMIGLYQAVGGAPDQTMPTQSWSSER